ncbi:hypothetical protein O181_102327 [Austropuccinia psidii MF-1]|uniref:Reverse transcriptase/retrotransposon-derived protein RNase H-like domain-containing protein n=1 Tax=Austropuccinia psidii MF-1 TaxID=1389203 RepID=A0A9Q3PJD1_9BASI|nr:hypothetical protein [Austropuccinia psidii MF-1]
MANLQSASSSEASRPPAFKTPSMKAPECFGGTQPFKVRSFIQSCQLILHNYPANFSQDRKKVLYATSFLIGRCAKWIEPYLSNLTNQDSNYLLNSWNLFESQLFTSFGDPNEVRKAEAELDSLRMKEGVHVSLYIANFRIFVSRVGDFGEKALIHHFRKGFPSRSLDQLVNDFSSAKSWEALVGDSRTPSFPSSIHIASLNSHQSLLSSRDEAFKDIQDVREDNSVFSLHLFFGNMDLPPSSYHDSLEELWDEEEEPEEIETMMKVVPSVYHHYLDGFSTVKAEKLAPHRTCDHHIELEGSLPPVGVIYSLSNQESDKLRACISENVEKGFIRPSSLSIGAPVLFVKKKDGGLHLCVDYRKLNAVTRKNKYPVPPMNQLLTVINVSSIFSKIDLCGAYNLLRIKKGDEHLKCFRTKYGSNEYLVMAFGLTNSPPSFQKLVNGIFYDLSSIEYLGYVVSSESLKMDQAKVQQILNWLPPRNLKALQSFLGFANFYRGFIRNYSKKISSLTSFLKKDSPFPLNDKALRQFHQLKEAFTISPILSHFDPSLPTIVETDASNHALGAVLSQISDSGKHPIAFDSCKRLSAELNYEINDKELLQ